MILSKKTAEEALRHYQSPGPDSSKFLLNFLESCVASFDDCIPPMDLPLTEEELEAVKQDLRDRRAKSSEWVKVAEAARRGYSGT